MVDTQLLFDLASSAMQKGFHNLTIKETAAIKLVQAETQLREAKKEMEKVEQKVAAAKKFFAEVQNT